MCFLQKPYILRLKSHSFKFLLLQGGDSSLQLFDAVGVLPLHAQVLAAHVAVSGQLTVDGLAQVEVADDGGGGQVEDLLHSLLDLLVGHDAGAEGVHHDGDGLCHAAGVSHLHINELLSALEFLRAGQPPKLYPLDLCELLQQVAAQADMVRAQLGGTLELDYGGWTAGRVLADRDDVELLCLHLLSTALRACREGGTVRILLRRSETMWQLTVRDNGCGLPEGSQEAWLENRRSFLGGAQLGLLLCRECCRRMGWGLSVECAPEKGTQAVVTVPLYTDDGRAPEVELHAGADLASEQQQYQLRAMLVRELRTMPERGDPDE